MRRRIAGAAIISVVALVGTVVPHDQMRASAQTEPCNDDWMAIDTDDRRSGNWLFGIAVRSPDRAWVVGTDPTRRGRSRTLVKRWDGNSWRREDSPNVRGQSTFLKGVDAGRKGALVAVGDYSQTTMSTFAIRRKRSGGWRAIKPVDPSSSLSSLSAVSVLSPKRVWAVGTRWDSAGQHRILIERFNGKRWRVAGMDTIGLLDGVFARRWDDIWAVGRTVRDGGPVTLTLRFNGKRWRRVRSPNQNDRPHYLYGVAASGRRQAWAVGERSGPEPLLMRWNGKRWRFVDIGIPRRAEGVLRAVSVHEDEVVAVGSYFDPRSGSQAFILTFDGESWTRTDTSGLRDSDELSDVQHASDGSAFAAGYRSTSGGSEAIMFRPPLCPDA